MNKKNEYDSTKAMLNTLRNFNSSKIGQIKEQENQDNVLYNDEPTPESSQKQYNDIFVINDVEIKMLSSDSEDIVLSDDEKTSISQLIDSFREQVSQLVELDPGFVFDDEQIRLDGSLPDIDINFTLIAGKNTGLYINSDMLLITSEVIEAVDKLAKFYPTFTTAIEPLLRKRRTT